MHQPRDSETVTISISNGVARELYKVLEEIRPILDRGDITPGNLISLLIANWNASSPKIPWVKIQANLYPGKGGSKWRSIRDEIR